VANDLLVAYGDRWQAAEATSCRASGGRPARLRDRQHACLERRLARADDLMALLTQPVANAPVNEAARGIEALGEPAACLRVAAEGAERDPPSAALAALAPLLAAYDRQVGHLVNLARMRRGAEARDVEGLVAAVRALGEPALLSRALAAQAEVYAQRERFDELEALLDEAGREGARANDDTLVAQAWTFRVFVLSEHLGRPQEARRWLAAADAAVLRAGNPPELRAQVHQMAAVMYSSAGEHTRALREIEAAVALRERYQPTAVLALAATYNSLASVLEQAGQKADARRQYERALALVRERHGDLHRDVLAILINLGDLLSQDDPRQAIGLAEQARRIAVQLVGPGSQFVAMSLEIEGAARSRLGEHGAAAALYRQALALTRARSGAMHPRVAGILGTLVDEELALGDLTAAVRDARECLRIFAATLGPHDTSLARAHATLGDALRRAGDAAAAVAEYRAALAIYQTSDGQGGEDAAIVRVDLGHLLANGEDAAGACAQFARAEPALRHAPGENHVYALLALAGLVACDAADRRVDRARLRALEDAVAADRTLSPEAIGFTAFARARASSALGDRGQARALAQEARAAFTRAGVANRSDVPARALGAMR
jgi:tetratricopeptide (TPR) repeat protein